MDDRDAFERQVAAEMARRAGPLQPVDDAAIHDAITAAPTPSRRFRWFHRNGHEPTVRGRTQQMFSPAKAIAAAALVFAVGGLLAAQLRGPDIASAPATSASQEPGLPGVSPAADQSPGAADPMAATYWTGTWNPIGDVGRTASQDGYVDEMGGSHRGQVAADDPRMSGLMTRVYNGSSTEVPGPARDLHIRRGTARIDNDAGAWVGSSTAWIAGWLWDELYVLEGEGAYEGLTAVFHEHSPEGSFEGVILAAELPPLPDPVAPPAE